MLNTPAVPLSRFERTVQTFFLLALFCVPFSTWLTNVFVGLAYLSFAIELARSRPLRDGLRSPPALLALGLLLLFALGTTWSIGEHDDIMQALRKYSRLLVLPVGIALNWRDPGLAARGMNWGVAGLGMLATSYYLVWFDMMPTSSLGWWRVGDMHDAFVFKNHITIGILLGFAGMVSFLKASWSHGRSRLLWTAAGLAFSVPVIFLSQGRTGYVAMFIGLLAMFLLRVRVTPLRTVLALAGLALLYAGFYATSDNFRRRTDDLVREVRGDQPVTANGLRMSYMRVGLQGFAAHPVAGLGTGSFAALYAPTAQQFWPKGSPMDVKHQPHSEFLLMAVQLGSIGLLAYFTLLGTLLRPALRVRSFETDSMVLLWTIYVSASSFNSLLWDTTEAYWFLLLASCLYAASVRRSSTDQ